MKLDDFNYNLPKELIAQEPVKPRTNSRLMVLKGDKINHDNFYNLLTFVYGDKLL